MTFKDDPNARILTDAYFGQLIIHSKKQPHMQATTSKDLANRLREVWLSGKWIANTNVQEQITGLDWKQAVQKVGNLNTIAQLTFHITYYLKGVLQVFEGGELEIRDQYSFDMPEILSENDWNSLVNEFISHAEQFITHVEQMDDSLLGQAFVKEAYGSYLRNIEGQIEHSYYHLGQISLLKKWLTPINVKSG